MALWAVQGYGVVKTWVGTVTGNNWNNTNNWRPSGIPSSSDDILFSNNRNCSINQNVIVNSINISSSYTGIISRPNSGAARTVTLNNFSIAGGSFNLSANSSNGAVTVNNNTIINGGIVDFGTTQSTINFTTLTGGTLRLGSALNINGDFIITGGTYNPQTESVGYSGSLIRTNGVMSTSGSNSAFFGNNSTISGGFSFNSITFSSGGASNVSFYVISNLTSNTLILDPQDLVLTINRDPIFITGDYEVGTSLASTGTVTSNNLFIFNGTGPQLVNLQSDEVGGFYFSIGGMVANNTASGVTLAAPITSTNLLGGLSVLGGSLDDAGFDITLAANQDFFIATNTTLSLSGANFPAVSGSGTLKIDPLANLVAYGGNNQTLSTATNLRNFTINKPTSGDVTLSAGTTVTGILNIQNLSGSNKLNTGGNLTLGSSATQTASLLDFSTAGSGGSVSGNVKVQRFYQGVGRPKLFGTPIESGATVTTIGESTWKALLYTETGQEANIPRIPFGQSTASGFIRSFRNANRINSGALSIGRGYSLRQDANGLAVFDGVVNNGTINVAVTNTTITAFAITPSGFNLMSNPYPSAIDWNLVNKNSTGVNPTAVNIFNGSTYTATNIIGSCQGFFVQATSDGNITFSNTARLNNATSNNTFLRTEEQQKLLYIYVKNISGGFNDALTISLNENATQEYNPTYDLQKILVAPAPLSPLFYTTKTNAKLSLDTRPMQKNDIIIPISIFVNNDNDYVFSTSNIDDWYKDYSVFLKDSLNNVVSLINLKTTTGYQFSKSIADTDKDTRFSLVIKYTPNANQGTNPPNNNNGNGGFTGGFFTSTSSEGVPDSELKLEQTMFVKSLFESSEKSKSVITSYENKILIHLGTQTQNTDVVVYDLMGNVVFSEKNINTHSQYTVSIQVNNPSIYIVKLQNNTENMIQKVLLY